MIRRPAVAGYFYESNPDSLKERIEWSFLHEIGPGKLPPALGSERRIRGLIVPHAGYVFSGPVAAHAFYHLAQDGIPSTIILFCPNHTGYGSALSTMTRGSWETPLGQIPLDQEFAEELVNESQLIDDDPLAHQQEHSCEVQLPFLQYIAPNEPFQIVPITMGLQDLETASEVGGDVARTAQKLDRDVLLVASTDLTHYQPADVAREGDSQVLAAIQEMDEQLLIKRIQEFQVTMCGYGPVISTLHGSRLLGAQEVRILKYATSGDTGGDQSSVVGYASAIIF